MCSVQRAIVAARRLTFAQHAEVEAAGAGAETEREEPGCQAGRPA